MYAVYNFTPEIMSEEPWIAELLSDIPISRHETRDLRSSRSAPPGRKRRFAIFLQSLLPGRLRPARRRILRVFAPHDHCICVYNTWFLDYAVRTELAEVLSRFDDVGIVSVDEPSRDRQRAYDRVTFAVRIGFDGEQYRDVPNLIVAPLGVPMQFVPPAEIAPLTSRRYAWSFLGEIKNPTRQAMVDHLEGVRGESFVHSIPTWNGDDSMRGAAYSEILADSIFVPSPRANVHQECYRTYEALECGAIPIVESAYYREAFEAPFPIVRSDWSDAAEILNALLDDPAELQRLDEHCRAWWADVKAEYPRKIAALSLHATPSPAPSAGRGAGRDADRDAAGGRERRDRPARAGSTRRPRRRTGA